MGIGARLGRLLRSDNLDLYLLVTAAFVVALLGLTGVAQDAWLQSGVLALLGFLAISQVRSRHQVARLVDAGTVDPLSRLLEEWPTDLEGRRAGADDVLLIGVALSRTIQSYRRSVPAALARGARVRVVLVDPRSAELLVPHGPRDVRIGQRIRNSLDELAAAAAGHPGLQVRLVDDPGVSTFNVLDPDTADGLVALQRREFRPRSESRPLLLFRPRDGRWYQYARQEAERIWDAAVPAERALAAPDPATRPAFTEEHDPSLWSAVAAAKELLITGVARNTLLNRRFAEVEAALRSGCALRVLLVDPDSDGVLVAAERYYAQRSPEHLRDRIRHSRRLVTSLEELTGATVDVRYTPHAPAVGVIAVRGEDDPSFSTLYAEYFTYQARGEPKFVLRSTDGFAFSNLLGEAEALWASATPAPSDE